MRIPRGVTTISYSSRVGEGAVQTEREVGEAWVCPEGGSERCSYLFGPGNKSPLLFVIVVVVEVRLRLINLAIG